MASHAVALGVLLAAVPLVDAAVTRSPTFLSAPRLDQNALVFATFGILAGAGLALVESHAPAWRDGGRREVRVLLLGLIVGMVAVCGPIFEVEYVRALLQMKSFPRALLMVELRFRYGAAKTALGVGVQDVVSLALAVATPLAASAAIRVSRSRLGLGLAVLAMSVMTLVLVLALGERRAHGVLAWILLPASVATAKIVMRVQAGSLSSGESEEVRSRERSRSLSSRESGPARRGRPARSRPTP
jgi:hypothetical protein